ncbi:DUF91 domain-containing protein [candidate division KSB1 bacterium]|nr:DUF91 domain-containing protein [candidate division KSB1 bacterium]
MPLYEINNDGLISIPQTSFAIKNIKERQNLQQLLKQNISVLTPDLLVISEEFGDWQECNRRIDLLAIDKQANLVVIEIKRTADGSHMELQAIRYAAMVSTMTFAQVCDTFERYLIDNDSETKAEEKLLEFLNWSEPDEENFGKQVRLVLVSADFSKEITTTVMWLNEIGLDISCYRLLPHDLNGRTIIDVQQIIPLPEAQDFQVKLREKTQAVRSARLQKQTWDIDRLLLTIRKNTNETCAQVAKELYEWSLERQTRIWWSNAKIDGSFIPVWDWPDGQSHYFFAVRSIGKVELYFHEMHKRPPFNDIELIKEFCKRLNAFGANLPADNLTGFPKFPLDLLAAREKKSAFLNVIEWALLQAEQERL